MDESVVLSENPGVSLMNLPEKCSDCTVEYAGKRIVAVGWGLTSSGKWNKTVCFLKEAHRWIKLTGIFPQKNDLDGMSSPNMMQVELAVNSKEECEKQFSVAYNNEYQLCTIPSNTKGTCQVIRFF